jgi:hypothetical protein
MIRARRPVRVAAWAVVKASTPSPISGSWSSLFGLAWCRWCLSAHQPMLNPVGRLPATKPTIVFPAPGRGDLLVPAVVAQERHLGPGQPEQPCGHQRPPGIAGREENQPAGREEGQGRRYAQPVVPACDGGVLSQVSERTSSAFKAPGAVDAYHSATPAHRMHRAGRPGRTSAACAPLSTPAPALSPARRSRTRLHRADQYCGRQGQGGSLRRHAAQHALQQVVHAPGQGITQPPQLRLDRRAGSHPSGPKITPSHPSPAPRTIPATEPRRRRRPRPG